ncbi:MAG TPA: ROK family protein [Ktedonobacteraceae bacterium]|nr:ROK family protein [Ktedonobacteraceae bacterium]
MNQAQIAGSQNLPLVLAVDLGGTQMRTAVLQGARLLSRVGLLTGANRTPESVIPRLHNAIQQALDEAHVSLDQVAGIGIATPGPLDNRTGIIYSPPNMPGWDNVPLRDLFNERYKVATYVENDANAAALGEFLFGAGRGYKNIVYLTISTGIGGGIIIDGRLIEGASGTAGELGHMSIDWRGVPCSCGSTGCLEAMASGTAIARRANEAIAAGEGVELLAFASTMLEHPDTVPDPAALPTQESSTLPLNEQEEFDAAGEALRVNSRTVARAAEAGVPLAREIITNAAEALGAGLVNIIHIFNPEMVILGGGVTQMGRMLMEPALRIVQERAMKAPREAVQISLAQLGTNVGLIGAGGLIYYYNNLLAR